jgi:hypothetical protein
MNYLHVSLEIQKTNILQDRQYCQRDSSRQRSSRPPRMVATTWSRDHGGNNAPDRADPASMPHDYITRPPRAQSAA